MAKGAKYNFIFKRSNGLIDFKLTQKKASVYFISNLMVGVFVTAAFLRTIAEDLVDKIKGRILVIIPPFFDY